MTLKLIVSFTNFIQCLNYFNLVTSDWFTLYCSLLQGFHVQLLLWLFSSENGACSECSLLSEGRLTGILHHGKPNSLPQLASPHFNVDCQALTCLPDHNCSLNKCKNETLNSVYHVGKVPEVTIITGQVEFKAEMQRDRDEHDGNTIFRKAVTTWLPVKFPTWY